jgi:outer membrane protein TolC
MNRTPRIWPAALLLALGLSAPLLRGQEPVPAETPPPPPPLTLADCLQTGLERQPSLAAARASLAAAQDNRLALDDLGLAALLAHELPVRRQQADLGITIARAGLAQAEWETIYAISRTYFSAVYAREQEFVTRDLVGKLKLYREKGQFLVKKGDPDTVVTQADVDRLAVNIDLFELRHIQAQEGLLRAKAALREAMGLEPDSCPMLIANGLPPLQGVPCRDDLLALALGRRGEMAQAAAAARVTELEVSAQAASRGPTARTFAAVADVHARPIPQGMANREYRPSAIGLDMPTTLAGRREDRVRRARDLSARAAAVVDKTRNLIALELDDAYLKWREAARRLRTLEGTSARARAVLKTIEARFEIGRVTGEEIIRAKALESQVLAEYNEALYNQALALAALERITAGGFRMSPGH